MRNPIISALLLLIAIATISAQDRQAEVKAVKALVDECGPSSPKATLLTRSLVKTEGKIAKFDSESLSFKRGKKYFRVLHRDILEIRCLDKVVTNVADPSTRPYAEWNEINQVYAGTKITIVLTDGSTVKGMSNSATDSHLIIFDPETNSRRDIPRADVAAYIAIVGSRPGARTGAARASEGMLTGGGNVILGSVAAAIGALVGAITKGGGRPILVYSR